MSLVQINDHIIGGLRRETADQVHSHVERLGCNCGACQLLVTRDASRQIPMLRCYSLTCACLSYRGLNVSLAKMRTSFEAGPLLSARLLPDPGKHAPSVDGAWQSRRRAGTLHADRAVYGGRLAKAAHYFQARTVEVVVVCSVIALVVLVGLSIWSYAMLGWNLEMGFLGAVRISL